MMKMFALGMLLVPMVVAAASTVKNLDDCFPRAVGGVMLVEKKPQPEVVVGAAS